MREKNQGEGEEASDAGESQEQKRKLKTRRENKGKAGNFGGKVFSSLKRKIEKPELRL